MIGVRRPGNTGRLPGGRRARYPAGWAATVGAVIKPIQDGLLEFGKHIRRVRNTSRNLPPTPLPL